MKRRSLITVLALVLTLAMTLCLAGCGQKQQPAEESTQTQTEQPAATEETTEPAANDTAAPAADQSSSDGYIGEDKALEIALSDAGFTKDQVSNAYAHLDYDDDFGRYEYEVEFHDGMTEYSYDIDAVTGEITDKDVDYDD